ncbi:MAG TPA: hypothetical protein VIL60_12385 [Rhodanobacter sp.]
MRALIWQALAVMVLSTLWYSNGAWANEAPDMPLEQKVHEAALVGIGTVIAVDVADPRKIGMEHIATIRIDTMLKGPPLGSVALVYGTGVYELDPLCCERGATYLFFLRRDERGLFTSINGPRGAYRIDPPKTWPYTHLKP